MTEEEPKPPQWVAARTARSALIMAILYSALCAMTSVFAATGASFWYWLLAAVTAVMAALAWASFAYLRRRGR